MGSASWTHPNPGKDLVSEQTLLRIQEAPETELQGAGGRLLWEIPLPVSLLSKSSIHLGSTRGRRPAYQGLPQFLQSLVSASLPPTPRCAASASDDLSLEKGWSGSSPPVKPRTSTPSSLLGGEETSSRWIFSRQKAKGEERTEWKSGLSEPES